MNELIEKRGRHSRTFDLGGGQRRVEVRQDLHVRKSGLFVPVNASVAKEMGDDPETGVKYAARSISDFLDYDIKFNDKNPASMSLKHLPTNKTIKVDPRDSNKKPDNTVAGNKISVSQLWSGIDAEIFIGPGGLKTNYIVTSAAGRRVVEFDIKGDTSSFRIARPWYLKAGEKVPTTLPMVFSGGVLTYDFREVPVGATVDPSFSAQPDDSSTADTSIWAGAQSSNSDNIGYAFLGMGQLNGPGATGIWRSLIKFDLSAITDTSVSVTNASLTLYALDGTAGAHSYGIKQMRRSWGESTCTWLTTDGSTAWESNGAEGTTSDIYAESGGSGSHSGMTVNNPYTITGFDADIALMLANQSLNYGWRLAGDEGASAWMQWRASNSASSDVRPLLSFDYTIETSGHPRGSRTAHLRRGLFGPKVF